jgi:short-subunit dehydrogenase
MASFSNQTAVITGGSSGIGKALALALAAQGAKLCLVGRHAERLKAVAGICRAKSPKVVECQVDLTNNPRIRDLARSLERNFESIDLLVHSAGIISIGPVESADVQGLDKQYQINVRAPYLLTQALLPSLKKAKGQIVFINSLVGLSAKAESSQYSVTKHALKGLADSLRGEVNPYGIRVLSVFLGRTATSMQCAVHQMEGRAYNPELLIQPDDVANVVVNALTLSRTAEVTDISLRHSIQSA